MRSWVISTQSLTPISWPTYLCISLGWANSRLAISYLDLSIFPGGERYHVFGRLRSVSAAESHRRHRRIIVPSARRQRGYRVPFVAVGSHLYRRPSGQIVRVAKLHRRQPQDGI